jgi:hypothetical protein
MQKVYQKKMETAERSLDFALSSANAPLGSRLAYEMRAFNAAHLRYAGGRGQGLPSPTSTAAKPTNSSIG